MSHERPFTVFPVSMTEHGAAIRPEEGSVWTIQEAIALLEDRGYAVSDAVEPGVLPMDRRILVPVDDDGPGEPFYLGVRKAKPEKDRPSKKKAKGKKPAEVEEEDEEEEEEEEAEKEAEETVEEGASKSGRRRGPRRRRKGGAEGRKRGRKVFKMRAMNLKKLARNPLAVTNLLWYSIFPEHFKEEPYPQPTFESGTPDWLSQMDFNPRNFLDLDVLFGLIRQVREKDYWLAMARDCKRSGIPAWEDLALVAYDVDSEGRYINEQILAEYDFPQEAWDLLKEVEEEDGDPSELWHGWIQTYFDVLGSVINEMKPEDIPGWFEFDFDQGGDHSAYGLIYYECADEQGNAAKPRCQPAAAIDGWADEDCDPSRIFGDLGQHEGTVAPADPLEDDDDLDEGGGLDE